MSRIDTDVDSESCTPSPHHTLEIIEPREVPLGGLRAMTVRRTLPNRSRTTIGPWCFLDHYGPDHVHDSGGMQVAPHPHTGLQTVSWLFHGEIEHRDSTGVKALVQPGTLNLMTAGRGVQHSEVSTPTTATLHGVQLWVVLPETHRHQDPHFGSMKAETLTIGDASVSLFIGSLPGFPQHPAPAYWPIVGAEIVLPAGGKATLEIDPSFEHGLLIDEGVVRLRQEEVQPHQLAYIPQGPTTIELEALGQGPVRALLIGGTPFEEEFVMWWNFIGRSHDEIVAFRELWESGRDGFSAGFGELHHMPSIPAPAMPSVRLRPRLRR